MLSDSYLQYAAGYQKEDVKSEDITKAIQDLEIMNDEHGAFWILVMTDENDEINHRMKMKHDGIMPFGFRNKLLLLEKMMTRKEEK